MLESLAMACLLDVTAHSQAIEVSIDPAAHHLRGTARFEVEGVGQLHLRLNENAKVRSVFGEREEFLFTREGESLNINLQGEEKYIVVLFEGEFQQDFQRGEVAGQIHNHSVNAHIGEEGVFLSNGSAWHPQWVDESGATHLLDATLHIQPVEGWTFVATGNPASDHTGDSALSQPVWDWNTPRPVDGVAVVGNRHVSQGVTHPTPAGPVEVVASFSETNAQFAPVFIEAACDYLDLYVPLLGEFPFQRFTIVENFFSSGFAYPGFTLLGPQVVAMGPRSLQPGYLDHELVHNWFGNGVYVDYSEGNWCEGLTSYCANYYRRVAEGGEEAGRAYRRGILMKASSDPETLDNGAPIDFGVDPSIDRFVGYDKVSFIFMMLEHGPGVPQEEIDRTEMFKALRLFTETFMGKRATWTDLQKTIEASFGEDRSVFFDKWVRSHNVPRLPSSITREGLGTFLRSLSGDEPVDIGRGSDDRGGYVVIDKDFLVYHILPPEQIVPTIAGTLGPGGVRVETNEVRNEVKSFLPMVEASADGENLFFIGSQAILDHADLIARCANPIEIHDDSFEVEGTTYNDPACAVLHSMPHPDHPGRFITVFHANSDAGWSHLRLVRFYSRDSTIVWEGRSVKHRSVYEPSRRLYREEE